MTELDSVRYELGEIKLMLKMLMPKTFKISTLSEQSGKSRQSVRNWLIRNGEPDVDYWLKDGKIIISEKKALEYLSTRRI